MDNDLIRRADAIAQLRAEAWPEDGTYDPSEWAIEMAERATLELCEQTLLGIPAAHVEVKPLEWVNNPDASEGGMLGGGVTNSIYHAMSDGWSFHRSMFWRKADNLEAAKAAAQADYEARIRSALA